MIREKNLSQDLIARLYPDIGQTFYVVDSDLRTVAQGWSKPDWTGPLDLFTARQANGGQVYAYRTGDYTADYLAVQAAVDASVDYRGDTVFFTPCSLSLATAVTIDSAGLRLLGKPVRNLRSSRCIITDAVGSGLTVSATDVEIGHLTMIPKTAQKLISVSNAADFGHIHDVY